MNNTLYEKIYRIGKQNKRNAILNFVFIALCLLYILLILFTTKNKSGELGEGLSLAIRLIGGSFVLISAAVVFLINGVTSAILSSKILKLSQGETIKKRVFTASTIIKIIAVLIIFRSAFVMGVSAFLFLGLQSSVLPIISDSLFALVLASVGIYQIVLIVNEGKSRKELFSV